MHQALPGSRTVVVTLAALLLLGAAPSGANRFHFGLANSIPAAQATVETATEVRLSFTEAPSAGTVSIRLVDAKGELVAAGDPTQDPTDPKTYSVAIPNGLGDGGYTVSWRGMGADGHVVRGDFGFTVAGP